MKTNPRTRNETEDHNAVKARLVSFFSELGVAFAEFVYCDVFVVAPSFDLAVEYERTVVNLLRNITRNFTNGASHVLIVVRDFKIMGDVATKLRKELPKEFHQRVAVMTLNGLQFFVKTEQ
jgi:hypothetical protein